jgi:hypothetical protein
MSFLSTVSGDVVLWRGNPNCTAAQKHVREWLKTSSPNYPVAWAPRNIRLIGNLGESVAFCCSRLAWSPLPRCFSANLGKPLSNMSRSGIDLLWIGFGNTPAEDFAIHQEVKTTLAGNLSYASSLLTDYEKSFGRDQNLTLNTHLQGLKVDLEFTHQEPQLAVRVNALMATSPAHARRLRIVPTLVHDITTADDPVEKLVGIEAQLTAMGWLQIETWSIAFTGIGNHFKAMAEDR